MPGLRTVYQLQTADLERAETARKLHEAENMLGETAEVRAAREVLQREEAHLKQVRSRVRELELEVQSLTDRITAADQQLYGGTVRNPKELEDLQADLRSLRAHRESLEDEILAGLTESDESTSRLEQAQARWKQVEAAWRAEQTRLEGLVGELRTQHARLDAQIAQLRGQLPADLLEHYEELYRKKGGRAIAAIRRGLCEGCRVLVPTSIVQQVRRTEETLHCTSCGRILCVLE